FQSNKQMLAFLLCNCYTVGRKYFADGRAEFLNGLLLQIFRGYRPPTTRKGQKDVVQLYSHRTMHSVMSLGRALLDLSGTMQIVFKNLQRKGDMMDKILFLNACVRPESRTYILAKQILAKMSGLVEEVNLEQAGILPLNWATLQERDAYVRSNDFSAPIFQYARQFVAADTIVIAAPYWDLSFPSTIKIYLEAVTVCGLSFAYTDAGAPKGLCKAKKLIYVTTAGGSISTYNLGYDYIKTLAHTFYEIPTILCYTAENLDIEGADVDAIMRQAIDAIATEESI
ncbi:MAG: NAD(P)H-dependent oxidoreductase, partial [Oscillospiraceae bacterium]